MSYLERQIRSMIYGTSWWDVDEQFACPKSIWPTSAKSTRLDNHDPGWHQTDQTWSNSSRSLLAKQKSNVSWYILVHLGVMCHFLIFQRKFPTIASTNPTWRQKPQGFPSHVWLEGNSLHNCWLYNAIYSYLHSSPSAWNIMKYLILCTKITIYPHTPMISLSNLH